MAIREHSIATLAEEAQLSNELSSATRQRDMAADRHSRLREEESSLDTVTQQLLSQINSGRHRLDDLVLETKLGPHDALVALTHDPKFDDLALMEALRTPAFYVGVLGSRKSAAARRERLLQFDVTAEQLERLRAPVGLAIGAKTPAEIAVSVMAQLTEARRTA